MKLIACCTPGQIGDTLHAMPAVKRLCEIHGAKADLFVKPWAEPARSLIEYQPYINQMRIDGICKSVHNRYQEIIEVPNPQRYSEVIQVSWTVQPKYPLSESFAVEAGLPRDVGRELSWEVPTLLPLVAKEALKGNSEYVVLAPRGKECKGFSVNSPSLKRLFESIAETAPWPVLVVGSKQEQLEHGIDMTGLSFLDMARIIAGAKAYIGMFSAPLVVAQGFEIPKTCIFDGMAWWPYQVMKDGETEYLVMPTVGQVIESANRKLRVKRTA